jgi:hypothetical protein
VFANPHDPTRSTSPTESASTTVRYPGPLDDWTATITIEKDRHGLLDDRNDRKALFHCHGGSGALTIDISQVSAASHRLNATDPVKAYVEKIATLNPPPITGNDAFKRLGEYRKTTLAAYKRWSRGTDE